MATQKICRAFSDRGLAADGSRTLVPFDGGASIFVPGQVVPPTTSMLVGSSLNPANAAQLNTLESQLKGTLGVLRLYDQDMPATWSQSTGSLGGPRPVVISFKPDIPSMGSGSLDAAFNSFLDTVPTNRRIYLTLGHHEGDVKINGGLYTLAQWRAAAIRMGNMIKARNVSAWRTIVIVTMQPWVGGKAYGPSDFWLPGISDLMSVDKYNPNTTPATNPYKPYSNFVGQAVTWFHANGVPWGITETGIYENTANLTQKAAWLIQTGQYLSQNGCQLLCYWDNAFSNDPDQTARRLASSQNSLNAYSQVMATYNP